MRYSAFISYNHRDKAWARWLHRALETYRIPKKLRGGDSPAGPIGAKLPPVFRDRDELAAAADLGEAVKAALDQSACLVVILSPHAAQSRWVEAEVRHFIDKGWRDRIRCLIVGGTPNATDPAEECLPPSLRSAPGEEPLAADPRPEGDGKRAARLKIVAGLLGLPYDSLRQRDAARRQKQLAMVAAGASAGLVLTSGLAVAALIARAQAVEQRKLADERALTAERTVGFVKSMFENADPSNARGAQVTVREVLDRGSRRIAAELDNEPAVRTELMLTLGEVYGSVGLFREGAALVRRTLPIAHGQSAIRVRQWIALGDVYLRTGEDEKAAMAYRAAVARAEADRSITAGLKSRALIGLGQALTESGDDDGARAVIKRALATDLAATPRVYSDIARDYEALGLNDYGARRDTQAVSNIDRALALRLKAEGPLSPSVSDNYNTLASIALRAGENVRAEAFWRKALSIDEQVLGADHPDLGLTLNNLARALVERRAFAQAIPLLERAIRLNVAERGANHDDLAYFHMNLGIARAGLGQATAANELARGLAIARRHGHAAFGPILGEIAEASCATGEAGRGLALLNEAERATRAKYGADDWRAFWLMDTRAGCLVRLGRRDEAAPLFARASQSLAKRWKPGTLYAVRAAERRSW